LEFQLSSCYRNLLRAGRPGGKLGFLES